MKQYKSKTGFTPLNRASCQRRLNTTFQQQNHLTGFTLVEMLVTVTIFSIAILAASGLFTSAIRGQQNTLASQELLDQASYSVEFMSRALRMAVKELNCTDPSTPTTCDISNSSYCLTNNGYGYNYEITPAGDGVKFINHLQNNDCQEFFLEGGRLKYRTGITPSDPGGEVLPLTSDDLKIDTFKFDVSGGDQNDNLQPRVTILLEIEKPGSVSGQNPKIKLQTSISQRNLDVQH